jgi:preprotein translocase subunit Sss1
MTPETLRAFLRAGIFVLGAGLFTTLLNRPDSPEFVVSVCSTLIGAALIGGVVILLRVTR